MFYFAESMSVSTQLTRWIKQIKPVLNVIVVAWLSSYPFSEICISSLGGRNMRFLVVGLEEQSVIVKQCDAVMCPQNRLDVIYDSLLPLLYLPPFKYCLRQCIKVTAT